MDNPYQPPDDPNLGLPSKPDLAYWVHGYLGLRVLGVLVMAAVTWYAETKAPRVPGLGWQLWVMLAWTVFGTLAAVGVAFRIRLAKHLLVVHLVCTAALELYGFSTMMGIEATGPNSDAVVYAWVCFGSALWDLLWAALFQFSPSLRAPRWDRWVEP